MCYRYADLRETTLLVIWGSQSPLAPLGWPPQPNLLRAFLGLALKDPCPAKTLWSQETLSLATMSKAFTFPVMYHKIIIFVCAG